MNNLGMEESQVIVGGLSHDSTIVRISNFLEMKRLSIADFWLSDQNCASA